MREGDMMVLLYQLDCHKVLSFIEAGDPAAMELETNTNNSEIEPSDYWDNTMRYGHFFVPRRVLCFMLYL